MDTKRKYPTYGSLQRSLKIARQEIDRKEIQWADLYEAHQSLHDAHQRLYDDLLHNQTKEVNRITADFMQHGVAIGSMHQMPIDMMDAQELRFSIRLGRVHMMNMDEGKHVLEHAVQIASRELADKLVRRFMEQLKFKIVERRHEL